MIVSIYVLSLCISDEKSIKLLNDFFSNTIHKNLIIINVNTDKLYAKTHIINVISKKPNMKNIINNINEKLKTKQNLHHN